MNKALIIILGVKYNDDTIPLTRTDNKYKYINLLKFDNT